MDEKLTSRAKLLYEINNNSPLFLRTAHHYLQTGDIQSAISILENGIKNYPDHPLAFILLGKAYNQLGNTGLVTAFIRKASDLLNSNITFNFYQEELKLPDKPVSTLDSSSGDYFQDQYDKVELQEAKKESAAIDDRLEEIAKAMMNTKFDRKDDSKIPDAEVENNLDKSKLASETLAKIYLSQGQKREAIEIYNLLIQRNPEKEEYYLRKIEEIQNHN